MKRELDLRSIGAGIEIDEVRELNSGLWTIADSYGGGGGVKGERVRGGEAGGEGESEGEDES